MAQIGCGVMRLRRFLVSLGRITFLPDEVATMSGLSGRGAMVRSSGRDPRGLWRVAVLAAVLVAMGPFAAAPLAAQPADEGKCLFVELYTRDDCESCRAAEEFLAGLEQRRPRARVVKWDLTRNPAAAERLKKIGEAFGVREPAVPSVYLCRRLVSGFDRAETTGRQIEDLFTIHVFWREGCPRCAQGKQFLANLLQRHPVFGVEFHEIVRDAEARRRFEELSRAFGVQAPAVPTFYLCGQLVTGYADDATTGKRLEALVTGGLGPCRPVVRASSRLQAAWGQPVGPLLGSAILGAISDEPAPPPALPVDEAEGGLDLPPVEPVEPLESAGDAIETRWFGRLQAREIGLPAFTVLIGLVDGFNPCAMWVLLFLLSILVNLRDRERILLVAGTFVVVSGLVYLAFMAAWLNVFLLIGYMRPAQVALGLLAMAVGAIHIKDFFAFQQGLTLSIPEAAKPGIYARVRGIVQAQNLLAALIGATVLAIVVNAVELLCSAGLPAMYTQILSMQELPWWLNYAYLGLYIGAYMLDDTLVLAAVVVTLSKTKLQERGGRWLKLVSGLFIFALGCAMLFWPEMLG